MHNDNLIEIADWLTKIIVGLGLVHLHQAVGGLDELCQRLAGALSIGRGDLRSVVGALASGLGVPSGPPPHSAFVFAMVLFFPITGFLLAYLVTRMFLQPALVEADVGASRLAGKNVAIDTAQDMDILVERQKTDSQVAGRTAPVEAPSDPPSDVQDNLRGLVQVYESVTDDDYDRRVAKKNAAARDIYAAAVKHGVARSWLAGQPGDGYIVALAQAAEQSPDPTDAQRLVEAGKRAKWKHAKYRIALGLRRMIEGGMVKGAAIAPVRETLHGFLQEDDMPLRNLAVRALLPLG